MIFYQEKYFTDGNRKLRYYEVGSGKPLLFLHGSYVRALTYKKVIDLLSKKYKVIAPDMPCFGKSSAPNNVNEYSEIIKKLLESLDLKNIAVVGHSLGGFATLQLAAEMPISHLILVDSGGIAFTKSKIGLFYVELIQKSITNIIMYRDFKTSFLLLKNFTSHLLRRCTELIRTTKLMYKIAYNNFSEFKDVNAKTLVLWGEKDELQGKEVAEKIKNNIKNSELKCVSYNHDWPIFKPELFYDIVIDWLSINNY